MVSLSVTVSIFVKYYFINNCIISLIGNVWAHKSSLPRHFLWKCLYQASKVSGKVFVLGYRFCLCCYDFSDCILYVPTVSYFLFFFLFLCLGEFDKYIFFLRPHRTHNRNKYIFFLRPHRRHNRRDYLIKSVLSGDCTSYRH